MRRMLALLLITFTLITLTIPHAKAQDGTQPIVYARRDVEILNAGFLIMNDTITLEAPQGLQVEVTSLKIGFPAFFTMERRSFMLWGEGGWQQLRYEETGFVEPRLYGYEVKLPSPVLLEGDLNLRIRSSYLSVDSVEWDYGGYSARLPVYPVTLYNMSSFVLHVTLPIGAELKEVDSPLTFSNSSEAGLWTLRHEAGELAPMRNENVTIAYTPAPDDEYLLDCELLQQGISIMPDKLRLEDTYVITNRGATINRFHLKLTQDASNIGARDGVGPLKVTHKLVEEDGGYLDLHVTPRSSVSTRSRWRLTVEYSVPRREHIEEEGSRFTLTYPAHGFPHYIQRLMVVATLPEGGSFIASNPEPVSVKKASAFNQQVTIDLGDVTPSERPEVTVEYGRSLLWSFFRPLEWMLIAAGAFAAVYILRRRKRVEEVMPEVRRSDLEEFLDLYRERVALLAEQEELERGVKRREMGREQFEQRSAEITRRQRQLLRTLRRLGRRLEAAEARMSDRLGEIRRAEAELEKVNTDLRNLEVRLRTRRVSRRDYDRRRREYLRRRSRARRRIEQAIAELQAQA